MFHVKQRNKCSDVSRETFLLQNFFSFSCISDIIEIYFYEQFRR